MARARNFEVMFNKFNVNRICTCVLSSSHNDDDDDDDDDDNLNNGLKYLETIPAKHSVDSLQ
jgi:hypothetical protein